MDGQGSMSLSNDWNMDGTEDWPLSLASTGHTPTSQIPVLYCIACNSNKSDIGRCQELGHQVDFSTTDDDTHDAYDMFCHQPHGGPDMIASPSFNQTIDTGYIEPLMGDPGTTSASWPCDSGPSGYTTGTIGSIMGYGAHSSGTSNWSTGSQFGGVSIDDMPSSSLPVRPAINTDFTSASSSMEHVDVRDQQSSMLVDRGAQQSFLSDAQANILLGYRQLWIERGERPADIELSFIAQSMQLAVDFVRTWVNDPFQSPSKTIDRSSSSRSHNGKQRQANQPAVKVSQTVADVRVWRNKRFQQPCRAAQAGKAQTDLLYRCTSGCSYSTNDLDSWQRHEQLWQPQRFWHCVSCRNTGKAIYICARQDKLFAHLKSAHKEVHQSRYSGLREHSEVTDGTGFELQCKFVDGAGIKCSKKFETWEDRTYHYAVHFRGEISLRYGPWNLRRGRDRWFDDDDSANSGSSGSTGLSGCSGSHENARPHARTSGNSGDLSGSASQGQRQHGRRSNNKAVHVDPLFVNKAKLPVFETDLKTTNHSVRQPYSPTMLVHIQSRRLIPAPESARYVALDHKWAASTPSSRLWSHADFSATSDLTLTDTGLPIPLEHAIAFVHDLGHAYLWVAELCEPQCSDIVLQGIRACASLHMVSVRCPGSQHNLLHFACRSSKVQEVHAWAEKRLTISHVRNLGHGSYGIVDEIKLNSGKRTLAVLARKELSVSRLRTRPRSARLQEVMIMQKLDHPHILRSNHAYYNHAHRSWNILMTPVADCTLRDYLAQPDNWSDKRSDFSKWYMCLAAALEYMHGEACRHKDIKPANILVSGHEVLLSDFGTSHDFSATHEELVPGDEVHAGDSGTEGRATMTPRYSAPEVAAEQRRGRKADIFSLGCVYAEMLTTELGHPLEEMHNICGMNSKSNPTFHQHLGGLHRWLTTIGQTATLPRHRNIATLCKSMTRYSAGDRPLATAVLEMIGQTECAHDKPTTCACGCLDRRTTGVPRSCSPAPPEFARAQLSRSVLSQRRRSGRGRRCRSRIVKPALSMDTPHPTHHDCTVHGHELLKAKMFDIKSFVFGHSLSICTVTAGDGQILFSMETQIATALDLCDPLRPAAITTQCASQLCYQGAVAKVDHARYRKLYWKALLVVRVAVTSHRGPKTQLTDSTRVSRLRRNAGILASLDIPKYFTGDVLSTVFSYLVRNMSTFEEQIFLLAGLVAMAHTTMTSVLDVPRVLL
ncbi:hypothetical protein LTR62_008536 [Meristemomyces frigidus]|uniref:Protein kinase domain-containing protein n=1 Tax=Meristemomyces frigidus TaxID=1508187 RepID=A0AAN7YR46_9PEZI|nr:hypothetical protein LTR62_008536 [Meristemomyces frigidus]